MRDVDSIWLPQPMPVPSVEKFTRYLVSLGWVVSSTEERWVVFETAHGTMVGLPVLEGRLDTFRGGLDGIFREAWAEAKKPAYQILQDILALPEVADVSTTKEENNGTT